MRLLIGLAAIALVWAQGTTPRASATDYPVHGEAGGVPVGAEFMVHSFGRGEQMYIVQNYLVVEVAIFRPKDVTAPLDPSQFALHINGKKTLSPQPPSTVAASLRHPEWRQRSGVQVGAGPVILGAPQTQPPFPGAPQPRHPAPPRAPEENPPGGIEKPKATTAEEVLIQTALPTDPHRGPVSGFLFFPYTGKTSSIKSLELTWQGAVLKLR
jgi:hypothetical protein